jgi:alanyl-tRNA synthetase
MVQFKRVFTGEEKRDYHRAVTSQKCVRAGGKHNDLENVGYTARHHTFFEMLGNFSFGDYFKREAIDFGWDLLTNGYGLPGDKLYATVFLEDDEAYGLWQEVVGLPEERIYRLDEKDNFWAMGDTGPCGPCSEVLIDQGEAMGCGRPDCQPGCDCDRYLELWNLVFMQFERDDSGHMTPLPKPSIDTGMGLERISAVVQGVYSNFETDLFRPLIDFICELSRTEYVWQSEVMNKGLTPPQTNVSVRAIADHARALAFLIGDGVLPENVGRGYVLRRILRRAVRHGRLLGLTEPFLHRVSNRVIDLMGRPYPDLVDGASYIEKVILSEEERFSETLDNGLKLLSEEIERLEESDQTVISGDVAFKLYDTYGFPLDLTADVGREHGLTLDIDGFESAMASQRAQSRASWKGSGEEGVPGPVSDLTAQGFATEFVGYDRLTEEAELTLIVRDQTQADRAGEGEEVELVVDRTPFYGEAGGQVGDTGRLKAPDGEVEIIGARRYPGGIVSHLGRVTSGTIAAGDRVKLAVDQALRGDTRRNHTATHILHRILRRLLGDHVKQAGSLVSPDRLRFDFTHFEAVGPDVLTRLETEVNQRIRENIPVATQVMTMEEAMNTGATALFEERYDDTVRVVSIGDFSMELCGGTHCERTGDIGSFFILSEGSVSAGVRRIEAVTGRGAIEEVQEERRVLRAAAEKMKTSTAETLSRIDRMMGEIKELKREIERGRGQAAGQSVDELLAGAQDVGGVPLVAAEVNVQTPKQLRELGDRLRDKLKRGVIALGARAEGKALLLVVVSQELQAKFKAGDMVKVMAQRVGGGGGGRPDMAQAGGPRPEKLDEALAAAHDFVAGR